MWAKADAAGVWTVNHRLAEFHIGKKVNWEDFIKRSLGRIVAMDAGRYLLREFVRINCGRLSRDCRAHNHVFEALERHKLNPDEMVLDSYPIAIGQHKELEEDKDKKKTQEGDARGRAEKTRGTLEEITTFVLELELPESDGLACFHKWEGNGWKNGGNPIKCWKSTIHAWKASGYLPSQKVSRGLPLKNGARSITENLQAPIFDPNAEP